MSKVSLQQDRDSSQQFYIRKLDMTDQQEVIIMYAQESDSREPMGQAYYRKFPHLKHNSLKEWKHYISFFFKQLAASGLSVGCFKQSNNELVGVSLAKTINYEKIYLNFDKQSWVYPVFIFAELFFNDLPPQYTDVLNCSPDMMMDILGVAIKHAHTGKQLLHKMMKANEELAIGRKMKYAICWASNIKTGIALSKISYDKISEKNTAEFQLQGVRFFEMIDQEHRMSTLWLKNLDKSRE